jgi:hypothetical protein
MVANAPNRTTPAFGGYQPGKLEIMRDNGAEHARLILPNKLATTTTPVAERPAGLGAPREVLHRGKIRITRGEGPQIQMILPAK